MDLLTRNCKSVALTVFIFSAIPFCNAQTFSTSNTTRWKNAGITASYAPSPYQVNILDFGADNTGSTSCNQAYASALSSFNGEAGSIYFPEGEYFFDTGITVPNNTALKGESVGTILRFNLGGVGDAIIITGILHNQEQNLAHGVAKGVHFVELTDASEFEIGDLVKLGMDDQDIMHSSWANGTLGQVNEIVAINGNVLELADPLTRNYTLENSAYVRRIEPKRNVEISCLKIIRDDATNGQTDNIHFRFAFNCLVKNVESYKCNFGHVTVNASAHIQIENSYFHHAHAYGGGGQAYGVVFQESSSFNLAQNNSFEHLRHSMLLQSGANGNVFGYNYSIDPFWEDGFLPSNSAGDAVLHGNYPYMNLFEGNVVQNIVVDASHGKNGPHNTFFRNRAELYGFFSDPNTPTDSMNIVGNEITHSGFPFGLYMVNGTGHQEFSNNVSGTVMPNGTSGLTTKSLYLDENEDLEFLDFSSLPLIGYPLAIGHMNIPAQQNYINGTPISCNSVITEVRSSSVKDYPVAVLGSELRIDDSRLPASIQVFDLSGNLVSTMETRTSITKLAPVSSTGIYLLRVVERKEMHNIKVLMIK